MFYFHAVCCFLSYLKGEKNTKGEKDHDQEAVSFEINDFVYLQNSFVFQKVVFLDNPLAKILIRNETD